MKIIVTIWWILFFILILGPFAYHLFAAPPACTWRQTLDAIRQVETGGCENEGRGAKGDKGKALGPYQIWNIYWQDAAVPGREYREVLHDKKLSELVVERYMQRYARESLRRLQRGTGTLKDVEVVARIHNGGPKGHQRKSTIGYWNKARAVLSLSSVTK